jgi:predicted N-acetyltransferase YhbS
MIEYRIGNQLDSEQITELYQRSTLGERRPIHARENVDAMLENANLIITAWDGERVIGISRSFSDFVYITYLSDLAVDKEYQKKGIGKELIRRTQQESGENTLLLLLAAPASVDYYPHIGFSQHHSAWLLKPGESID